MKITELINGMIGRAGFRLWREYTIHVSPERQVYRTDALRLEGCRPYTRPVLALRASTRARVAKWSMFDEESIALRYLAALPQPTRWAVDVGAHDGTYLSNTFTLFRRGYRGLAVESDPQCFARLATTYQHLPDVRLFRCAVTPRTLVSLFELAGVPHEVDFVNLDVDSFDRDLLIPLLASSYRPRLICVEVNEKIPPPIRFAVRYSPDYQHTSNHLDDHFYGQSIAELAAVCARYAYDLVALEYNNAFLMPHELALFPALDAARAYRTYYLERPDRRQRFPWNAAMEPLLCMPPPEALAFLRRQFAPYAGHYDLSLD